MKRFLGAALVLGLAAAATADEVSDALVQFDAAPYVEQDPLSPQQVELGRKLAFDPRLSANGALSCMSCHQPGLAFTDGLKRARGVGHLLGPRNTPTLLNLHYRTSFFWDGRAHSVEEALLAAVKNPLEMNQDLGVLVKRLNGIPGYVKEFDAVYGPSGITVANIAASIGAFVRMIDVAYAEKLSAFDKFREDPSALSPSARQGLVLFAGKARCVQCHATANFADDKFHNVGLAPVPGLDDKGRAAVDPRPENLRAFKTPSLRQAALTGPYMHDGRLASLREVVDFFDRGGDDRARVDPAIRPLGLSGEEKQALVDFLKALSAPTPKVVIPALPPAQE